MIAILLLSILTTTTLTLTMSIEKTSIVYNSTTLPQIHSYYRYDDTNPFHLLTHLCYKQVDDGASGVIDLVWVCNDDEVCDELTCVINYYTHRLFESLLSIFFNQIVKKWHVSRLH